jgi:hypothetical protein
MLLSDLTPEQTAVRSRIVDTLSAAGWTPTMVHEMAEDGDDVNLQASLEYDPSELGLTLEYDAEDNQVHLTLGFVYGDRNRVLIIDVDDKLDAVLQAVIALQDSAGEGDMDKVQSAVTATGAKVAVEEASSDDD